MMEYGEPSVTTALERKRQWLLVAILDIGEHAQNDDMCQLSWYKLSCVPIEDSDQPAPIRSLT